MHYSHGDRDVLAESTKKELFMHNSLWQKQIYHQMQILTVNFLLLSHLLQRRVIHVKRNVGNIHFAGNVAFFHVLSLFPPSFFDKRLWVYAEIDKDNKIHIGRKFLHNLSLNNDQIAEKEKQTYKIN